MTWKDVENRLDKGNKNFVYVAKPCGSTVRVYNYAGNSTVNTILSLYNIWGKNAYNSFVYKDKIPVVEYELANELYPVLRDENTKVAVTRLNLDIIYEEDLED